MSDRKRWATAYLAIRDHVRGGEVGKWSTVRAKFPELPEATFFRYIRAARQDIAGDISVAKARRCLADQIGALSRSHTATQDGDAGKTEYVSPSIAANIQRIGLLDQLERGFDDVDLLTAYALDDEGRIKRPQYFSQAISLRDKLVATALRCTQVLWNLEKILAIPEAVIAEVAAESPDAARRIIERLHVLDQQRGMSIEGRV